MKVRKIYVSRDGREFDDRKECMEYEALITNSEKVSELKNFKTKSSLINNDTSFGFSQWYKIKSSKDLDYIVNLLRNNKQFGIKDNYEYVSDDMCDGVNYQMIDKEIAEFGYSWICIGINDRDNAYNPFDSYISIITLNSLQKTYNEIIDNINKKDEEKS